MEEPTYKIGSFEGPLDLLLELIEKNKVEITDIPIALIFDQYMEYLGQMASMNMDIAGEFIDMASELILIKSRVLLPKQEKEEEEDPRAALARRLLEYKQIRLAAKYLSERLETFGGRFEKEQTNTYDPPPQGEDVTLGPHTVRMLESAFRRIWNRFGSEVKDERPLETTHQILKKKYYPVGAKIVGIMRALYKRREMTFGEIMMTSSSRTELVAAFAAVLELLKSGRLVIADCGDGNEPAEGENILMRLDMTHRRRNMTTGEDGRID